MGSESISAKSAACSIDVEAGRKDRIELVEFRLRRIAVRQSGGPLHLTDDRMEGAVGVLWRTKIAQSCVRLTGETLQKRRGETRFADAGLAGEQHHLAFASLRPGPAPQQQFNFFVAPYESGEVGRVQRLEAAFRGTRSQRPPGPRQPDDAFKVQGSEVPQHEEIAESLRVPSAMTTASGSAIA